MIDRQVMLSQTAFDLPGSLGAVRTITLARPQLAVARDNLFDPVTEQVRPVMRAGRAIVLTNSVLAVSGVTLTKVELVDYRESYGSPSVTPLFSNGSSDSTTEVIYDGVARPFVGWTSLITDILDNIVIGANQQIVLTVEAAALAAAGTLNVQYDFGRNDGDLRLKS